MKLRTNLFLIIGGLLLTFLLAQWWVLTHLKHQLRAEVSSTAFEVSRDTASAVVLHQVKIRTQFRNVELQKQRLEWHQKHPGGSDSDVFIELKENQTIPVIELLGPGLNETIIVSQQGLDDSFSGISNTIIATMSAFLLFALLLAGYFSHRLSKPLQQLVNTAKQVGDGKLGEQVDANNLTGPREVQTAISEFNAMSAKLKALEAHNRQLQNSQQLSELGEIARGFAHSLRNPLNTLGLATTELADEALSEQKKQQLNTIIQRQILRIDSWIKSFMTLSQDNAIVADVEVTTLVDELVLEFSSIKPDISWNLELAPNSIIRGMEQELRTILQILLENAMEASASDGNIQVLLENNLNSCDINILDEGCGIPEEIQNNLFVPQVTSKGSGAGMGLFIAKRLVESRYKGTLEINNRADKGVEVKLCLNKNNQQDLSSEDV